jgi:hypothetical protein
MIFILSGNTKKRQHYSSEGRSSYASELAATTVAKLVAKEFQRAAGGRRGNGDAKAWLKYGEGESR